MKFWVAIYISVVLMGTTALAKGEETMPTAEEIIKKLDLKPLPGEGGFYRETYKSDINLPAQAFGLDTKSARHISTAIYYLVIPESFSSLHRIKSDEIFHFYAGDPVDMIQIDNEGNLAEITIGPNVMNGETPQVVVPRGNWQALKLKPGGKWALMGTTVSPGFEFEDFELGDRNQMTQAFPQLRGHISEFTVKP